MTKNADRAALWFASAILLAVAAASSCRPALTDPANMTYPLVLSDVQVVDRQLRAALTLNPEWSGKDPAETGILIVFCATENFDVRLIRDVVDSAVGIDDPELGGRVLFATLIGKEGTDYLGAWWYGQPDDPGWTERPALSMRLPEVAERHAGVLLGKGYMTIAVVGGRFPENRLALLSRPVSIPYDTTSQAAPPEAEPTPEPAP